MPPTGGTPGTLLWRQTLPHKLPKPYVQGAIWQNYLLLPTIEESYGRQQRGMLYALALNTGTAVWQTPLPHNTIAYHLVVSHDLLLVATEYVGGDLGVREVNFLAFDPATGAEKWQYPVPGHSIYPPAVCGDTLLFTTNQHQAYLLQLPTGKLQATVTLPQWQNHVAAVNPQPPTFYLGLRDNTVVAIEVTEAIKAHETGETTTAQPLYSTSPGHSFATIATHAQQTLYIPCRDDRHLYALNTPTGRLRWRASLERGHTSPPSAGLFIYIGVKEPLTAGGQPAYSLYAYHPDDGALMWQFAADKHVETWPAVGGGQLFIGSLGGTIYALAEQTGELLWSYAVPAGQRLMMNPLLTETQLLMGTREGELLCLLWQQPAEDGVLGEPAGYRAQGDWPTAVLAALAQGAWEEAAQDCRHAERFYAAGQLYAHRGAWGKAGENFLQAAIQLADTDARLAQRAKQDGLAAYEQAGDMGGQARALLALERYEEAAGLYGKLRQPKQAAQALEKVGRLHQAAFLYLAAQEYDRACTLYRSLNEYNMLATTLVEMGRLDEAVRLLVQTGRLNTAVSTLLQHQQREQAITLLLEHKQYTQAGDLYRQAEQLPEAAETYAAGRHWLLAAQVYEEMGATVPAAESYEKADRLSDALRLYQQEHKWRKAWELVPKLRGKLSAAQTAKQTANVIDDLAKASGLWESAATTSEEVGLYADAAGYYEKAGKWGEAARLYTQLEQIEQAARCWAEGGEHGRGATLAYQHGYLALAATLWEEAGALVQAAQTWAEIPNLAEAARLYAAAGEVRQAFSVLTNNAMWDMMRHLAKELNQPEEEAQACLELAKQATPAEQEDLYLAAGYAFRRAAEGYEAAEAQSKPGAYIAELWQQAADYLEKGLVEDMAQVAFCRWQVVRLRGWPSLTVEITPESALVEEVRSFLQVKIHNVGFGSARHILCKVLGTAFGSELQETRRLVGLRPQTTNVQTVSVCPQAGMVGTAVPIHFLLTYQRPDNVEENITIKGYVDVRSRDSQQMTPISGFHAIPTNTPTPTTVIYAGTYVAGSQIHGDQINDGGQKGDKVEISRPAVTPPPANPNPMRRCPHCATVLTNPDSFCHNCGQPLTAAS
jgi:outer membrane protein assembly factor BamB